MTGPVKRFRSGGISAAIFENTVGLDGIQVKRYSVQVQKTYRDKDGEYKHTSSFRENELPKVALVVQKAYEYLALREANEEAYPDIQEVEG